MWTPVRFPVRSPCLWILSLYLAAWVFLATCKTQISPSFSLQKNLLLCHHVWVYWPLAHTSHAATVPRSPFLVVNRFTCNRCVSPKTRTSLNKARWHWPPKWGIQDNSDDEVRWIGSIGWQGIIWTQYKTLSKNKNKLQIPGRKQVWYGPVCCPHTSLCSHLQIQTGKALVPIVNSKYLFIYFIS